MIHLAQIYRGSSCPSFCRSAYLCPCYTMCKRRICGTLRYGLLVVMMTYVVSYIIAFIMMKIVHVPRGPRGIFINMVVNDNCLFIGLPVQIALFGPDALPFFLAVLYW